MRLNKTRQTTKALADFNRAIKSNPDDVFAYCSRGVLKVYRFIDPEGGSMDLDRAIEIDGNYADAYSILRTPFEKKNDRSGQKKQFIA